MMNNDERSLMPTPSAGRAEAAAKGGTAAPRTDTSGPGQSGESRQTPNRLQKGETINSESYDSRICQYSGGGSPQSFSVATVRVTRDAEALLRRQAKKALRSPTPHVAMPIGKQLQLSHVHYVAHLEEM
jgi:hypothetical protein